MAGETENTRNSTIVDMDSNNIEMNVSNREKVHLHELVLSLGKNKSNVKLRKETKLNQKKYKILPVPLVKPQAEKIQRTIAYDQTSNEISKWDNVVHHNRLAEHITFPLRQPDIRLQPAKEVVKRYTAKTPLELEIEAILNGSKHVLHDDKLLTQSEEEALKAMSLQEAIQRRGELHKARALQSYMEAKARRQNKIKSKSYHRLLKRERMKKQTKEFEVLKQTNPEAALEKLDEIQKGRIEERMTLKHRGKGKWAKQMASRAKYDKNAQAALKEQLQLNRELTQKVSVQEDDEDDKESENDEDEFDDLIAGLEGDSGPWLGREKKPAKVSVDKVMSEGYRKVWENARKEVEETKRKRKETIESSGNETEKNQLIDVSPKKKKREVEFIIDGVSKAMEIKKNAAGKCVVTISLETGRKTTNSDPKKDLVKPVVERKNVIREKRKVTSSLVNRSESNESRNEMLEIEDNRNRESMLVESTKRQRVTFDLPREQDDDDVDHMDEEIEASFSEMPEDDAECGTGEISLEMPTDEENVEVDFDRILSKKSTVVRTRALKSAAPQLILNGDDDDEDDPNDDYEHRLTLAEAFADDDVTEAFNEEKEALVKKDQPKDIDLYLPGWGNWAGIGIRQNKRKKRAFTLKPAVELPKRKDFELSHVIINESKTNIASLQVSEVPFPFTKVYEFERSLQAPVGKDWNPESAYRKLIAPKVSINLGAIVEPIDADALVKQKKFDDTEKQGMRGRRKKKNERTNRKDFGKKGNKFSKTKKEN